MEPVSTSIMAFTQFIIIIADCVPKIVAAFTGILTTLIGLCAALMTILPHPTKPGLYSNIHHIINMIGCNFGNAKNAVTGNIE